MIRDFVPAISFLTLILALSANARVTDGKIQFSFSHQKISGSVSDGYHVNREAPASLETADGKVSRPPQIKELKKIVFDGAGLGAQSFSLQFYLCDNANTVCESHELGYQISGQKLVAVQSAMPRVMSAPGVKSSGKVLKLNSHGFIEEQFADALALAKKQKKKLLVDFRAPWCPACIRLESEVFDQAAFKKATASVVKLSINIDLLSNKELAEKYAVKAIPTLLILDAAGDELYRSLDFKPTALLSAELTTALKENNRSYANLRSAAEAGDSQAKIELGRREFKALNYKEAAFWLSTATAAEPMMLAISEIQVAMQEVEKDEAAKRTYQNTLEKYFGMYPDTFEAIVWRNDWGEEQAKIEKPLSVKTQEVLRKNLNLLNTALANSEASVKLFRQTSLGDYSRFEVAELIAQKIRTVELLSAETSGASTQGRQDLTALKKDLRERIGGVPLSVKRPGELILALYYANLAGDKAMVVDWYEKLINTNPHSYVYYRRMANFYIADKEFAKALPYAEKTLELGKDTPLQHHYLLAKVQKGLQRKLDAQGTITKALALPEAQSDKNKKVVQNLESLRKEL